MEVIIYLFIFITQLYKEPTRLINCIGEKLASCHGICKGWRRKLPLKRRPLHWLLP